MDGTGYRAENRRSTPASLYSHSAELARTKVSSYRLSFDSIPSGSVGQKIHSSPGIPSSVKSMLPFQNELTKKCPTTKHYLKPGGSFQSEQIRNDEIPTRSFLPVQQLNESGSFLHQLTYNQTSLLNPSRIILSQQEKQTNSLSGRLLSPDLQMSPHISQPNVTRLLEQNMSFSEKMPNMPRSAHLVQHIQQNVRTDEKSLHTGFNRQDIPSSRSTFLPSSFSTTLTQQSQSPLSLQQTASRTKYETDKEPKHPVRPKLLDLPLQHDDADNFIRQKNSLEQYMDLTRSLHERSSAPAKLHSSNSAVINRQVPRIPDEILRMDAKSVKLYLKILETGTEKKHDIRVIVVGKQGAGKTCLIRRLLYESLTNVSSTNGIEIHVQKCKVRIRDGKWIIGIDRNSRRQSNARLLNSVLQHVRKTSSSDMATVKTEEPQFETANHKQEQSLSINNSFQYAVQDLRDIVDAGNEIDEEEYATLSMWDFAGDKEYYNTHQTFMSYEAVYLVVTNLNDKNDIEAIDTLKFWFDSIHCYGVNRNCDGEFLDPPVIAIGTHKDKFRGDCNVRLFQQVKEVINDSRRHLRHCYSISNTNDSQNEFNKIRRDIFETAQHTSNWGAEFPLKFIQLEKTLNSKQQEGTVILTFREIQNMALEMLKPITSNEEIDLFLRYQHEMGNLIYFSDIPEYIVLDPQWLANAFSSIVTAEKFQMELLGHDEWDEFQRTGMLKTRLLNALFKKQPINIQRHQDHIIKVMEKFDILIIPKIATGGNPNQLERHYFVPCMIQSNALSNIDVLFKVPDHRKTSCLCYVFNFLPQAFINHLVVFCVRRFTTSKVRDPVLNKKQPALFRGLGVFNISDTGLEKLLLAVFDNTVQIQIWKFGNIPFRIYTDIDNIIRDEIDRIQREKYRMINLMFKVQLKCPQTKYNNLDGLKESKIYQNGQQYWCDEHEEVHEFIDDWFKDPIKEEAGKEQDVSPEEKAMFEKVSRRLIAQYESLRETNKKATEKKSQKSPSPAYKVRLQRNFSAIVNNIIHDKICDRLIEKDVLTFEDLELIENSIGQIRKNRTLMSLLLKKGKKGYDEFVNALRDDQTCVDLADTIENTPIVEIPE